MRRSVALLFYPHLRRGDERGFYTRLAGAGPNVYICTHPSLRRLQRRGGHPMNPQPPKPTPVGRAAGVNPPNRFERMHVEDDWEQLEGADETPDEGRVATEFLPNATGRLITENDSPDVPFRYSINPYRGCEHGCAYCYARPGARVSGDERGARFRNAYPGEVRRAAAAAQELAADGWRSEHLAISGVTDCYQPAERRFRLHARLPGSFAGSAAGAGHHHQERTGMPRSRPAGRAGRAESRARLRQRHDARRRAGPADGAAHRHARGAVAGDPRVERRRGFRWA